MHEDSRNSMTRFMKLAPWLCFGSVLLIAATFLHNNFYNMALFGAPIVGLFCFAMFLARWRTGKEIYAHFVSFVTWPFFFFSASSAQPSLLWGSTQSLAVAVLFIALPMLLFSKPISRWLSRGHG